jgi:hypothetical protein
MVFMGVCSFCGGETANVSRPMAGHMRNWARRNAQRDHTPRENIPLPSSLLQYPKISIQLTKTLTFQQKEHIM